MINKLKRLSRTQQKSSQATSWVQPMPMPEDIFLRKDMALNPSLTSTDGSMNSSCHSVEAPDPHVTRYDEQNQGKGQNLMKVYISAGLEPGQAVKIRYPNGKKMRASIPPKSTWRSGTSGGPFFLAQMIQ